MNVSIVFKRTAIVLLMSVVPLASAQTTRPSTPTTRSATAAQNPEASGLESRINMSQVGDLLDKARQAGVRGNDAELNRNLAQLAEIAQKAETLEQYDTYEYIFLQILKIKNDYPDALLGLGELYRRTNPTWAADYYGRYIAVNPGDWKGYYGRGSCYLSKQSYTLAIQDLQYLVDRMDPNHVGGLVNLALAFRGRSEERNFDSDLFRQAIEYMRRGVQAAQTAQDNDTHSRVPELQLRYGRLVLEFGQVQARNQSGRVNLTDAIDALDQALVSARDAVKVQPRDNMAWKTLSACYDALSDLYAFQSQRDPRDPNNFIRLADITEQQTRIQLYQTGLAIVSYLDNATQADPTIAGNWIRLAQAQQQVGNLKDALAAADKAVALAPDNADYKKLKVQLLATTRPATTQPKK